MEDRVARLERSVRRMKRALAGAAAVIGLLLLAAFRPGQQADEVLRVRGLVITDEAGRERILIGAPIPAAEGRVRTDPDAVRDRWARRFPDPDRYMEWYRDYRHSTNGMLILGEDGYDRLVVGDPVPDPNTGRRIGPATGIVINDDEGFERSGYGLLDVDGSRRVVLGLDSDRGTEGLTLFLFDEGRVGIAVQDGEQSIFLGNAPAGDPLADTTGPFSGLVFRQGGEVTRVIGGGDR